MDNNRVNRLETFREGLKQFNQGSVGISDYTSYNDLGSVEYRTPSYLYTLRDKDIVSDNNPNIDVYSNNSTDISQETVFGNKEPESMKQNIASDLAYDYGNYNTSSGNVEVNNEAQPNLIPNTDSDISVWDTFKDIAIDNSNPVGTFKTLKNMWSSLAAEKNRINNSSLQGEVYKDINPKLDAIRYIEDYTTAKYNTDTLQELYDRDPSLVPNFVEDFNESYNQYLLSKSKAKDALLYLKANVPITSDYNNPNYIENILDSGDSTDWAIGWYDVFMNNRKVGMGKTQYNLTNQLTDEYLQELKEEKENLLNKKQRIMRDISTNSQDIVDWENKIEDDYLNKRGNTDNLLEYVFYELPALAGSSFASWEHQAGAVGSGIIAGAGAIAGGPIGWGVAAGAGLSTLYNTRAAREEESLAEISEGYEGRLREYLASNGIDDNTLTPELYEQLTGVNPETLVSQPKNSQELMSSLLMREVPLLDENLSEGLKTAENSALPGLQKQYDLNMALGVSDLVQVGMNILPIGKAVSVGLAAEKQIASTYLTNQSRNIVNNVAQTGIKHANNKMSNLANKVVQNSARTVLRGTDTYKGLPNWVQALPNTAGKLVATGFLEGVEEGNQFVFQQNYQAGLYDDPNLGITDLLNEFASANVKVTKTIIGVDPDPLLANNDEFWESVKGGFALGIGMSGGASIVRSVTEKGFDLYNTSKMNQASSFIQNSALQQLTDQDLMNKAKLYTAQIAGNNGRFVLNALNDVKQDLPEGVTEEMIDEEIEHFNNVEKLYRSKKIDTIRKQNNWDKGSIEHGALIGFFDRYQNEINDVAKTLIATNIETNDILNDFQDVDISTDINNILSNYNLSEEELQSIRNDLVELVKQGNVQNQRNKVFNTILETLDNIEKPLQRLNKIYQDRYGISLYEALGNNQNETQDRKNQVKSYINDRLKTINTNQDKIFETINSRLNQSQNITEENIRNINRNQFDRLIENDVILDAVRESVLKNVLASIRNNQLQNDYQISTDNKFRDLVNRHTSAINSFAETERQNNQEELNDYEASIRQNSEQVVNEPQNNNKTIPVDPITINNIKSNITQPTPSENINNPLTSSEQSPIIQENNQEDNIEFSSLNAIIPENGGQISLSYNGNPVEYNDFELLIYPEFRSAHINNIIPNENISINMSYNAYKKIGNILAERGIKLTERHASDYSNSIWKRLEESGNAKNTRYGDADVLYEYIPDSVEFKSEVIVQNDNNKLDNKPNNEASNFESILAGQSYESLQSQSNILDPYYEQEAYSQEDYGYIDDMAYLSQNIEIDIESEETFVISSDATNRYLLKKAEETEEQTSVYQTEITPAEELNGGIINQLGISDSAKEEINVILNRMKDNLRDSRSELNFGLNLGVAFEIFIDGARVLDVLFREGVRNFKVYAQLLKEKNRGATTDKKLQHITYRSYEIYLEELRNEGVDVNEFSTLEQARSILSELYPDESAVLPETTDVVIQDPVPITPSKITLDKVRNKIQEILNLIVVNNEEEFRPELFYRNPQEFQEFIKITGINGTNNELNNRIKNDSNFINNVEITLFAKDLAKANYIADDEATWANNQYIIFIIRDVRDNKTFGSTLISEKSFVDNVQDSIGRGVFDDFIYNDIDTVSAAELLIMSKQAIRQYYKDAREAFNEAFNKNNPTNKNDWRSYFHGNTKSYLSNIRIASILRPANRNAENKLIKRNFNEIIGLPIKDLDNVTIGGRMTENQMPIFLAKSNNFGDVELFDHNGLPVFNQSRMNIKSGLMYTGLNNRPEIAIDSPYVGEFPGLSQLLYNLLVKQNDSDAVQSINARGERLAFTPRQLINFIVNRKNKPTIEDINDLSFWGFNVIDNNGNKEYLIGKNRYNSNEILNEVFITEVINKSIIFNKSQKHLFGPTPGQMDNDITMRNNELNYYNGGDIRITDDLIIKQSDLNSGKTWLSWYLKNGVMKTGLPDNPIQQVIQNNNGFIIRSNETEQQVETTIPTEINVSQQENEINPDELLFGSGNIYRVKRNKEYTKIDVEKERKLLNKMLGDWAVDNIRIVDDFIKVAKQGVQAFGVTREDSIILYSGAEEGTLFHEAFHRVSLFLLDSSERQSIYNAYKDHNNLQNLSNQEVEELLAEDFRSYVLNQEKYPINRIQRFFTRLLNIIKAFIGINNAKIQKLFQDINSSKFANIIPSDYNIQQFRKEYGELIPFKYGDLEFKTIPTYSVFQRITKTLASQILSTHEFTSQDENQLLDAQTSEGIIVTHDLLNNIDFNKLKNNLSKLTNHPKYGALYTEIVDNYSIFVEQMKRNLAIMSIKVHDKEHSDPTVLENEEEVRGYEKDSTEISVKNNAPLQIKFFVSTIVRKDFVGNQSVVVQESYTGLREFYDFDESWNKIISNISKYKSFQDMYDTIAKLAKRDPFFESMQQKIDAYFSKKNSNAVENFKTKFFQTFSKFENRYVNLAIDGQGNVFIQDANFSRAERSVPTKWNVNFLNDSDVFQLNKTGELTPNPEVLVKIQRDYNNLANRIVELYHNNNNLNYNNEEFLKVREEFLSILKRLGINIGRNPKDTSVIDELFINKYGGEYSDPKEAVNIKSLYQYMYNQTPGSIFNFITKDLNNITKNGLRINRIQRSLEDIFHRKSGIRELARVYASVYPSKQEAMVNSADGGKRYIYSLPSFITDQVMDLNFNYDNILEKKSKVPYAKNSLILKTLYKNGKKTNSRLDLKSFTSFIFNNTGDRGRDYIQISPLEDYITKLTALYQVDEAGNVSNYLTVPVLADKKGCYFIKVDGLRLPHGSNLLTFERDSENRIVPTYTQQTIDVFVNYLIDEIAAIRQTQNLFTEIENEINPEVKKRLQNKLAKNYHKGKGTPKGLMFRYFKRLNIDGNEQNLNDILTNHGVEEGLVAIEETYINNQENRVKWISNMLNDLVVEELKEAQKIGAVYSSTDIIKQGIPNFSTLTAIDPNTGSYTLPGNILTEVKEYLSNNFSGNLAEGLAVYQIIADYTVNNIISIQEFEKMFQGDPAFHANNDNKIKRLGILNSTGNTPRLDWPKEHRLNGVTDYTIMEITDSNVYSDYYQDIFNAVKNMFVLESDQIINSDGLTEEQYQVAREQYANNATEKALIVYKQKEDGSGVINQGDGGVYISPEMFRNLMQMDNEWTPVMEEAYKILISDEAWWLKADRTKKVMPLIMQPLKYVSYNTIFEQNTSSDNSLLEIPIADKMAMFTIWKGVATGDLSKLYDRMMNVANPVHMVKFESAVKVGNRAQGDFYSNPEHTQINDLFSIPTYRQKYRQIRKQLLTDPHDQSDNSLGTQVIKAALSNIIQDRLYDDIVLNDRTYTGSELAKQVFDILNHLSNLGAEELYNEFGSIVNDEFVLDVQKLSNRLIKEAKSAGMSNNVIEALTYNPETGRLRSPLSAISEHNWLQSRIISMINDKAINVHTAGGSAIQMSSFGLKSTELIEKINKIGKIGRKINNGKKLRFLNDDGSMDAVVSINLFKDVLPDEAYQGIGWSFEAKRNWLFDKNIIGENSKPSVLGYRIPTQGQSSLSVLKMADVLPENVGDVVILPDEFTALTGSDFDIDKLYIARYYYEDGKKISFSDELGYLGNSREANVNRMLDVYMGLLTSKYHIHETRMPLDNPVSLLQNVVLKDIQDYKGTTDTELLSFEELSPHYQLNKKNAYFTGKTGLGPFALNNVHHVLTQLANLEFLEDANNIVSSYGVNNLNGLIGNDNVKILDWLNALISAHVDVAKDPYIIELGVNPYTYNMTNLLLRTGKGAATFYFLSQDIIKDMSKAAQKAKGKFGQARNQSSYRLQKELVQNVIDEYEKRLESTTKDLTYTNLLSVEEIHKLNNINTSPFTISKRLFSYDKNNKPLYLRNKLKDNFIPDVEFGQILNKIRSQQTLSQEEATVLTDIYRNNIQYLKDQIKIGKSYLELEPFAGMLAELVSVSQVDTKKYGNSFITTKSFSNRVAKVLSDNNFLNLDKLFGDTFIRTKLRNSVELIPKMCKDMILVASDEFYMIHNMLLELTGNTYTRDDILAKNIANAMEGQIKANFFNRYTKENDISVYDLFFSQNSIPKRLGKIHIGVLENRYPSLVNESNLILNYIRPNLSDDVNIPDGIITEASSDNSVVIKQDLIHAWEDLINSEDAVLSNFAKDLVVYAFYSSQDKPGKNTLFDLVPLSYREEIGYVDYMRNQDNEYANDMSNINIQDIFLNSWWNDNLVPNIPNKNDIKRFYNTLQNGALASIPSTVIIPRTEAISRRNRFGQYLYRPYYKYKDSYTNETYLYYLIGTTIIKDVDAPVYRLIPKRGYFDNKVKLFLYNNYTENNKIVNNNVSMYSNNSIIESSEFAPYRNTFRYIYDITPQNVIIGIDKIDINVERNSEQATLDIQGQRKRFTSKAVSEFEYTRENVQKDINSIYIFEDDEYRGKNIDNYTQVQGGVTRYSKMYAKPNQSGQGYGYSNTGNDSVRGLGNAFEITVGDRRAREGNLFQKRPWQENEFNRFKETVDKEINTIKESIEEGKTIKFINDRKIGFGLPNNLLNYLNAKLVEIGVNNYNTYPAPISGNTAIINYITLTEFNQNNISVNNSINETFEQTNTNDISVDNNQSESVTNNITEQPQIVTEIQTQIFVSNPDSQGRTTYIRFYVNENLEYIRTERLSGDLSGWYPSDTSQSRAEFESYKENTGLFNFMNMTTADMWNNFQNKIISNYPDIRSINDFVRIWEGFSQKDKERMLKHLKLC